MVRVVREGGGGGVIWAIFIYLSQIKLKKVWDE